MIEKIVKFDCDDLFLDLIINYFAKELEIIVHKKDKTLVFLVNENFDLKANLNKFLTFFENLFPVNYA